ncbi:MULTISPECIES: type II toxin-antitoxin system RelE/ParE family toxin [Myroides]|uniref:type II toxin-antitoxin system RelE/ParE family toxin n=1 Tax=Myroides odoratus TaxID=256 RepID=UPI0024C09490|nr:type II toxin-antitoxin system RelE/ParE family toxin [Myroides sp. mNGS23_01]WHT39688.1 type II toxin-antitoxin system RelE/ParE family toxin [Myroides sp. mNGS23_01]
MKVNYVLTRKAVDDLSEIWAYTYDSWSEKQANSYYERLLNACKDVANEPKLGRKYSEIAEDLFVFSVGKHLVFYQIIENKQVVIIRFLHERMDIKAALKE